MDMPRAAAKALSSEYVESGKRKVRFGVKGCFDIERSSHSRDLLIIECGDKIDAIQSYTELESLRRFLFIH
jgi:hypothetical protein